MKTSDARGAHGSYQPARGQTVLRQGAARVAFAVLVAALAATASACAKSASHIPSSPTPAFSFNPPATSQPSVTVTATASPTPTATPVVRTSPTPVHRASPKASASASVKPATTPSATPTVQVSEASGSTKTIALGTVMTLTLVQDANTTWTFTTSPNPSILALTGDQTLAPLPTEPATSTRRRFTFKAVGVGSTGFALSEEPVGSPNAPAVTTYSLNVTVTQ
jgi:hypothetical protein